MRLIVLSVQVDLTCLIVHAYLHAQMELILLVKFVSIVHLAARAVLEQNIVQVVLTNTIITPLLGSVSAVTVFA